MGIVEWIAEQVMYGLDLINTSGRVPALLPRGGDHVPGLCGPGHWAYPADLNLDIGGTPYSWILTSALPSLSFADFSSVLLTIIGVCANGAVALILLILVLILAWNYLKLLFEAAERYVLLGVLVFTAPVAFAMGVSQATSNIFLLLMNAWCLRLFTSMVGAFITNPLSL